MNIGRGAMVDALIPLVIPTEGITRGNLARKLNISYSDATRALERLRRHRLLRRHIRKARYIYRLTGSRRSLSMGTLSPIYLN